MGMRQGFRFAILLGGFVALVLPVSAEYYRSPQEIDVSGPYTQEGSGMVFPESVAGFARMGIARYNSERTDESVNYLLEQDGQQVVVTVYVYPVPLDLGAALAQALSPQDAARTASLLGEQFFAEEEQIVLGYHRGAEILEERETYFDQRGSSYKGYVGTFRYDEDFFGDIQPVISQLYLFPAVGKNWMVKYRVTYPDGYDGAAQAMKFIDALPWTLHSLRQDGTP
jgi:hypothetical protein